MLMHMRHTHPKLQFTHILPYGAVIHDQGVQFVVFSRSATEMRLLLYDNVSDTEPVEIINFDPEHDRWGDIWSVFVPGIGAGQLYHFQANGPNDPSKGQRFNPNARLIDPYAKALAGRFQPGNDGVTTLTGKAIVICVVIFPRQSSTRCTSADSQTIRPVESNIRGPTVVWSTRFLTSNRWE